MAVDLPGGRNWSRERMEDAAVSIAALDWSETPEKVLL
jgi:hypothetical protein